MNLKACCGLLATRDDEDHDYEDNNYEPLPKPRVSAESAARRKGSASSIYANAGYSSKRANSLAAAAEKNARFSGRDDIPERAVQKAAWEAGAASAASTSSLSSLRHPSEQRSGTATPPVTAQSSVKMLEAGGGISRHHHRSSSRDSAGAIPVASTTSSSSVRRGASAGSRSSEGPRRESSSGRDSTAAARPGPKGAVGIGDRIPSGWEAGAAASFKGVESSKRGGHSSQEAPAPVRFDLRGFVVKLHGGVLLTKVNRQGRAKVRTLFYDEQNKMLWWNEPGGPRSGGGSGGLQRPRGSSLLSRRKEQPLPITSLVEVKVASQMVDPFCMDSDVDKSLQLVFPSRTVDLVAKDAEEAALLVTGFQELKAAVARQSSS